MKLSVFLGQFEPRVKVIDLKATQLKAARREMQSRKPSATRADLFGAISDRLSLPEIYYMGKGRHGRSPQLFIVQDDDPSKVRATFELTFVANEWRRPPKQKK